MTKVNSCATRNVQRYILETTPDHTDGSKQMADPTKATRLRNLNISCFKGSTVENRPVNCNAIKTIFRTPIFSIPTFVSIGASICSALFRYKKTQTKYLVLVLQFHQQTV